MIGFWSLFLIAKGDTAVVEKRCTLLSIQDVSIDRLAPPSDIPTKAIATKRHLYCHCIEVRS
jgi:hypothetical protein